MKSKPALPPKIEIRNLQRKSGVDVANLECFSQKAAALCVRLPARKKTELQTLTKISVLIVSDRRMAALHRRFMNEIGPTDVMTFQHGEIFLSADTAARNARRFGSGFNREVRLYIVHGLLHLHGLDDRDPATTRRMRAAEKKILRQLQEV